jgi:hypothetical protein
MTTSVFSRAGRRAALAAVVLAAGCGSDAVSVCPLLGCMSGLTVHLASLPAAPFRLEITVDGDLDVVYSYDCTTAVRCNQDVMFPGLTADNVHVTVRVGNAVRSTDAAPSYIRSHPNGPNCPPECLTATITVLPPS